MLGVLKYTVSVYLSKREGQKQPCGQRDVGLKWEQGNLWIRATYFVWERDI